MLNNQQLKLIHIAAREAGLIDTSGDRRYRLLLKQYRSAAGDPCTSSRQLSKQSLEDFLSICESMGFRAQGRPENYYRKLVAARNDYATRGQQEAIDALRNDLGWTGEHLANFILKMTKRRCKSQAVCSPREASKIIDALKAILNRSTGRNYQSLTEIRDDFQNGGTDAQKIDQAQA